MSMWFQNSGFDNGEVVLSPGRLATGRGQVEPPQSELFLRSIRVTSLRVGDPIFRRGDNVEGLYLLKSGVVKLTSKCAVIRGRTTSEDYISKLIGSGDFFGFEDFFLNSQHQQEARAVKPSEVLLYPKEFVQRLMETGGSLSGQLMSQVAKQW